ncbi:HNH endonuclease [Salinisphaera orenii]|uniref:HNH endonuclease n=1 Tax=Salinisphaera orenii TaxID=856731 RepID=UPI000DBE198B
MRGRVNNGEKLIKSDYYRALADRFDRSPKSFEYRFQNISHVYELLGRSWLQGCRPARNVGGNVARRIQDFVSEVENHYTVDDAGFKELVAKSHGDKRRAAPNGTADPSKTQTQVTSYRRDHRVVAWILDQADGLCECCTQPAPFQSGSSQPYLEVHHVRRLADGGPDTTDNAVALCPNCHRELHYGVNAAAVKTRLISSVAPLVTH